MDADVISRGFEPSNVGVAASGVRQDEGVMIPLGLPVDNGGTRKSATARMTFMTECRSGCARDVRVSCDIRGECS